MPNGYITIDEELKAQGFKIVEAVGDKRMPYEIIKFMLDYARGLYINPQILPAHIALRGNAWIPVEPTHLIYAKTTAEYEIVNKGTVHLGIGIPCKHVSSGEISIQLF